MATNTIPTTAAQKSRPTTCGALFVTSPDLAAEGCKRLPRHRGDHRKALTIAAVNRAAKPKAKARAKVTKADIIEGAAKVADGTMTASAYLSLVTAFGQKSAKRAVKAAGPKAARVMGRGAQVTTKSGLKGKVVSLSGDTAKVRLTSGAVRSYAVATLSLAA